MIELYNGMLNDGTNVNIWKDEEIICVQFGYLTFSMPEELWKDFQKIINFSEKHRDLLEKGMFEQIPSLKHEINIFNSNIEKTVEERFNPEEEPFICDECNEENN